MNSTENTTDEENQHLFNWSIVLGLYYCIASFLGVISNLFIIFTIGFGKHVGKQVKIQLIHLAVADLLWSVFYLTFLWTDEFDIKFVTTTTGCKVYIFIAYSSVLASPFTSAAISIESVFIIYFPFKAVLYRDKHKYIVIVIIWLCAILSQVPFILEQDIVVEHGITRCDIFKYPPNFYWIDAISFYLPSLIVFISYSLVFIKLRRRKRSHVVCQSTAHPQSSTDKVLLMLFADAFLTIFTWTPAITMDVIRGITPDFTSSRSYSDISNAFYCLLVTNAFSSFIIYFIFNNNFRKDYRLLFQQVCSKITSTAAPNTDGSSPTDITLNTI